MKDTTATDVLCVLAIIVPLTVAIQMEMATSLARVISQEKVAISLVLDTIAKVVISLVKADIVPVTIAKAAISQEKAVTNREREAIVLATTVMAKEIINLVKVATIVVLALKATILMQSIA